MIIDPFKKMQNYIELSHKVLPSGQIDTSVIRTYISDKNEYEDIISLTENKINEGLINTNQISKYFKFNTKTDITTPSEILRKYKEAQTESSINSIIGTLKDLVYKNTDFSVYQYSDETTKTLKSIEDNKAAIKWLRSQDIVKKGEKIDDPLNHLKDYILGIKSEMTTDERLDYLIDKFNNLKITYTFNGQEGRPEALFGIKNYELNSRVTSLNLQNIIRRNIELHTRKKLWHIALGDKSIRKMILDKHLNGILDKSLNQAMESNYNSIQSGPLDEVIYNMAPQSREELNKQIYKTEETKAKEAYIKNNNNINKVVETINTLREQANSLISEPNQTGTELFDKTLNQLQSSFSIYDGMSKTGSISKTIDIVTNMVKQGAVITSFDFETVGSAITEVGFDTAKVIDNNKKMVGLSNLSELIGINKNGDTSKNINDLLAKFKKASKLEKEKIINSNEGYILKYLTMIGNVTGGSVASALKNESIGLEEDGKKYFSRNFKAQNSVNIEDAEKGLKFFNELHDIQMQNTKQLNEYSIPMHELRLLQKLKDIKSNKEYAIGHNVKAFDLNKLRTFFMTEASEGGRKYYLDNYNKLLNGGYEKLVDSMLLYRAARGPEQIAGSPNVKARLLGETEHTNTAMALRSGIENLNTMHVALNDAETTVKAFLANEDIVNFIKEYNTNTNKKNEISNIKTGSILLGTSGNIPSRNGNGVLGFTYDPLFEENNGIRFSHSMLNGDSYTSFADTIKKGSAFEVQGILKINAGKIDSDTLEILRKIDPQLIGSQDDLYMFVFDQMIDSDHNVSKTKTQRHYWIGTKNDLEEQISTHFEHIADKTKSGEYSIDKVADSVKEKWSVNLSTVSPEDMEIYFGETEPGKKYAFSAEYLIDRGKKQAQKDTALSSLRRSTMGNITDLLKIGEVVQNGKHGSFQEIVSEILNSSQNMAKKTEDIFGIRTATQNKLFNVLSLYDMFGPNINFFGMVNTIAKEGISDDMSYDTKNLIYSDTLSNAIDLMQELVDKSLDSETPLRTKASPVFKYMEDIVELGYKSASSSGKVTYNPSRKNRLRSLQIDLNGANYSIGNKLLASGAYSSHRTKEGAYSAFFSDKAGELGFKSDSGKIYNPVDALNYIREKSETIKKENWSLTKVLKEGHKAGKISYIDRNQYQHNGYDTVNGYMVSMLKAKRIISPTSIRQYQPSRYVVTEENIGEFYNILSPVNQEKFKGVLSNKLNLQHTSYKWINGNDFNKISDMLVYNVLVSGFEDKGATEIYAQNNKQFSKDLNDVKNYVQQFLSALKDKNNGNLGIKINKTSGLAELIVDNNGSGMAIDISKILPSIRYTSSTKDYVMKFGSNVFFNPSVLTKTKHGYDIQSHANIVLSQLQGIFKWIQNTPEDATANDLAGRIEYLGSTIAHELAKKTTPVLSEQDLRHKNNFIYEDFFNLVKEVKNSAAFSQAEINKYLDTEQAKEVIENLTNETKLTDEDKLKLITDRRGIVSYITENKALKKSLFRARSSDGIIEYVDEILKRMMYSMDVVHKVKPQEDMTATSHGYGDLALSRFGARDPRYAQSVLNRSVEHNGALRTEEELAKLDIKLGRGIYGNAQEAAHARTHSYRALVLNINTEEYFKNYLGQDFDTFAKEELLISDDMPVDIIERIKSVLTHSVDNNASLINPNQFLAMAKGNITSITRDREIVDFDNLYYMISRQHRGLIRNAEKQKEATAFVLDLVKGEFNYKSGTYINTHDLTALKESWINELDEDLARRGGILKGGFRRKTQKGDIVSEDDIKKILDNEDFRREVKSYAEKYGVSEDDAFKKVLSGSKYDLEYIRYVSDIDVAATRKYLISQEKSSAVIAMAGAGSLNKKIRETFKTIGMDQFIGMQLSDEFIDSLKFDGNKFSGLFYEAAFSDTEGRSISNKEKQKLFRQAFENWKYTKDTKDTARAVDLFKYTLKKERTSAWNIFEDFLRSKGELRYDQHLGAIASTMGDRIKASHGDVITNLTDILVNTNGATEETRNTIIGWFDNGEVNENNVILDEKEGSITLHLDENKQYHLKANKLKETFGEDFFGKKYWYMSFTEANDPKNPGHNLDGPDKGAKIHPLTIGTLEKQRLHQNEVEDVYNRYERLYGEEKATEKFNELFEGIARRQDNSIILEEGHNYGEVLMPETMKSLRNQVWSEFSDSRYRLEVDKKSKKIKYVLDKERVNTIFKDGVITPEAEKELLRRKVSKNKIDRLGNLDIAKKLNLSIDKAVTLSSVLDIKEAYEFNYNLSKYDEHQKAKLVEKMKTDYEFNIIDNISKINTVDRVGTTENPYSMFNSHVIRLDEDIASLVGQDMVAVPYMPTSFKSYTDGSEIKTQVQSKEIDFIRAVEAYTQANASNDKNLSRYENDVRSRFAELNTAIEEAHITKMSVAKDAMTKRAIRSFSAKGNLVRSDIQSGITPEKMQYAMIDGISLAERAQRNAQVASVFINRENYIRMLGGVDHLKALYNEGLFKGIKHFDLDEILDMVNRKGGTLAILRRNPENYQVSNIPVHVFLDRSLAPGKIEAEDKLAALLNLDTDGDQISLAAVLGKHKETGRAMTSAEAMLMNDTSSDSLFRETRRASEIIMSSLAKSNVGTEERMKNYVKSAGESAKQFHDTLDSMTVGGNVVDRVMSSVTDNGSIKKMDELRARYREIVSSDEFKAALEKSGVTLKELEQSTETFKSVADEYLRNTGVDSKDQDALMYMWGNMHDTETLAKKLQQNQAGIINMNTARARSIFLQLQNIAEKEGRVIDPNARRSIDAMMIWIEENAQVSKHSGKLSIPELGDAFKSLFGIEKSKTDINHFLDLMETKYNLFDTDETEGKLREQLTQFGYEGKMTKNQMAEYMQSLLPENKVINEEYYNGVERQYIRKSALGWDYDEIREKEKTALTMYYKGEYSDNSLEKELSELVNGMSADGENTLRKIDILSDPQKTQSAYEEKAQRIMERQASFEIPEIDNIVNNIDEVSLKDVAHGAVANIGKVFKSSKGILGLAGSIMAAGFIGGNPTAPSGTEARQAVDDSQPYEIPNMMGDMMPQIGQQAPAGYIINVNASSGKGQDYISGLMQQALRSQFPNQNISMTMNINDSSSNISLRDVASYLKDAI